MADSNEQLVAQLADEQQVGTLLTLSFQLFAARNYADLHTLLHAQLKQLLPFSHFLVAVPGTGANTYRVLLQDTASPCQQHPDHAAVTAEGIEKGGIPDTVLLSEQPFVADLDELLRKPPVPRYLRMQYDCGMREAVFAPLRTGDRPTTGVLLIFATRKQQLQPAQLTLIRGIASLLSTAVANLLAREKIEQQVAEISAYKQQLESEKQYLQQEIQTNYNYSEIVGTSTAMRKVFHLVSQVAATSSTVLLLGETGTGKELIARAVHNGSARSNKVMVKVNCATLPANLIESELFGHERGSFTGAVERRIGKFELANNSTLFLDEVGELPPDLQVKLLRALQEKEIERVGGNGVIKTDVRVIAATNRNLQKEVQSGHFRSDLYFRLNVFPIRIAPLRERPEDIPVLASHFLLKHAKKGSAGGMSFSSRALKELMAYSWPGNVRELEHLVERSILLTTGNTITQVHLTASDKADVKNILPDAYIKTIDEVEREYIVSILKKTNGKVAGVGGAAELLQLPPTTLNSKIKRLNIKKGHIDQ